MANAFRNQRNAVDVLGGVTLAKQTSSPIAADDCGLYADSSGNLMSSLAGLKGGVAVLEGAIPSARLVFTNQPSNADTIGIGGKTFTFLNTLIAADATVQVKIGSDAATTLASLVKAINGTTAAGEWVEATTPFAVAVVADAVSTSLRIRNATARGGTAVAAAPPSVALAEAITAAQDIWNAANLNVSGKAPSANKITTVTLTVTAAMITAGGFQVELPFTPTSFAFTVTASTGVLRATTDALTISSDAINVAMAGGASPALQACDLVRIVAFA